MCVAIFCYPIIKVEINIDIPTENMDKGFAMFLNSEFPYFMKLCV